MVAISSLLSAAIDLGAGVYFDEAFKTFMILEVLKVWALVYGLSIGLRYMHSDVEGFLNWFYELMATFVISFVLAVGLLLYQ